MTVANGHIPPNETGQRILAGLIFLILAAPLLTMELLKVRHYVPVRIPGTERLAQPQLNGMTVQESMLPLSVSNWLSGRFQNQANNWYNQNFGLREPFVRLDSQLNYSLFGRSYMYNETIFVGKEKNLYEKTYLTEYYGIRPAIHPEESVQLVQQLSDLQTRLQKRGVAFVLLITPSKAAIYPELTPDVFVAHQKTQVRGYDRIIPLLRQNGIEFVDGHEITQTQKQKNPQVPMFPRGGTHWTDIGAFYTVSALLDAIDAQSDKRLPHPRLKTIKVDNMAYGSDGDLARLLNILLPPVHFPTAYSVREYDREKPVDRSAKLVIVGGSFTGRVQNMLADDHVFGEIKSYFYYTLGYWQYPPSDPKLPTPKINWEKDVLEADALVLEINEERFVHGEKNHFQTFLKDALSSLPVD